MLGRAGLAGERSPGCRSILSASGAEAGIPGQTSSEIGWATPTHARWLENPEKAAIGWPSLRPQGRGRLAPGGDPAARLPGLETLSYGR